MNSRETPDGDMSEDALRRQLTPMQFHVTQEKGTERAFSGVYWDTKRDGTYHCVVCDAALFDSETKYDSGSGWPSFWQPTDEKTIRYEEEFNPFIGTRIEIMCSKCGAHLGHVFEDGPKPTGRRYCVNSASLNLQEEEAD